MLEAKVLEVSTRTLNADPVESASRFKVYEFSNGLIMVPGDATHDWFFDDRDSIEACGNDVVVKVEETGATVEFSNQEFFESVEGSQSEFGDDSVPEKYLELGSFA